VLQEEIEMKKQVPESNDREQQMAELRESLRGHRVFGKIRGNHNGGLMLAIDHALSQSSSPSDFCRKWDEISGDLRIIGNIMAVLKRDGKTEALEALRKSLLDPNYSIPGETIRLEKVVPLTLVMFEPEKTLSMLRWIIKGHWMDLDQMLDNEGGGEGMSLAKEMFSNFPSLREATEKRRERDHYEGWELGFAYQVDILRKIEVPEHFHPLHLSPGQYNDHLELTPPFPFTKTMEIKSGAEWVQCLAYFGFWVEADQKEALSLFTREQQESIATWQFQIHPDSLSQERGCMEVGLHPENEHNHWSREYAFRSSAGMSHGMGAIFYPPEDYAFQNYNEGDAESQTTIVLSDSCIR
jgi:hypothetical protein